jgi:hypothetical protein
MSLTMISSNIAGYTKKQITAAVVFIGFCIGNAVGPQTFIDKEKRAYFTGGFFLVVSFFSIELRLTIYSGLSYSL